MTKEDIKKEIYDDRVDGIYPGEKESRWIQIEELESQQFFIVYSDDGGDTFVKFAEDEENFQELMQSLIVDGDTNCDFDTSISLIIRNGEKYKPTIS